MVATNDKKPLCPTCKAELDVEFCDILKEGVIECRPCNRMTGGIPKAKFDEIVESLTST